MRKKISLLTILLIFSLFVLNKKTLAVIPTESPSLTIYPTQINSTDNTSSILIDLFKIFFSTPNLKTTPSEVSCQNGLCPSPTLEIIPTNIYLPSLNPTLNITNIINTPGQNQDKFGYVYYDQCHSDFGNTPLPQGCTICRAGCGPTTVSMIVSSFFDPSFNPKKTIDYYQARGYYIGCSGSYIDDAKKLLKSLGFTTTDYRVYKLATADKVYQDFKKYLDGGWTIFALANFCENGCGHFFWVVDVDDQKNIWAYDPYYGRKQLPPFNENQYYPFPKYRYAFGVRK